MEWEEGGERSLSGPEDGVEIRRVKGNSVTPLVIDDDDASYKAWKWGDEFDGEKKKRGHGDGRENWSLGRLEEYKALQSSGKWMMFDMGINILDVALKCAGKGFKTCHVEKLQFSIIVCWSLLLFPHYVKLLM